MESQIGTEAKSSSRNLPAANRQRLLERELERWLPLLIQNLDPEQILLFGSLANRNFHEWSDIDLVIIQETDLPFLERTKQALKLIRPKVGVDLLIYTPEEFSLLLKERRFFREEIMAKGRSIYARQ